MSIAFLKVTASSVPLASESIKRALSYRSRILNLNIVNLSAFIAVASISE